MIYWCQENGGELQLKLRTGKIKDKRLPPLEER